MIHNKHIHDTQQTHFHKDCMRKQNKNSYDQEKGFITDAPTFEVEVKTHHHPLCLCVLAFLRVVLHSESNLQSSFPTSRRRSRAFVDIQFVGPPKVAFLFLVRRNLPLDFLWGTFFKNGDAAKLSIYFHSEPGFVFDESTTRSAFFFGRQLNNSIQVVWGSVAESNTRSQSYYYSDIIPLPCR